jgi:oligopeptide transport system ATP-binding protein
MTTPAAMTPSETILETLEVTKWYPVRGGLFSRTSGHVRALDGVSLTLRRGEVLGLVGESGCGKTTLGRVILHLVRPTSGTVLFEGRDVARFNRAELQDFRERVQTVFQDPMSSLNPRMTVETMLREALLFHGVVRRIEVPERIVALLEMVGLNDFHARRYPHQFSSGQRQRIGIARALAVAPSVIVCDEPVSALDVSIQAQILNLLMELRERLHLTYLFISHDLGVVRHIAHRVAVMYLGRVVECADMEAVTGAPLHPYTRALMSAAPVPDPDVRRERLPIGCDVPSPSHIPPGCPFHPRCPEVQDECRHMVPLLGEHAPGHFVRCLQFPASYPLAPGMVAPPAGAVHGSAKHSSIPS